jgi:CheY-like chemotaxis protein
MNTSPPVQKNRILVVEDTPANIQILVTILKDRGYQISVAMNGKQALDVLDRVEPDLVLLDGMMPEMDGFETCRHLNATERWRQTPVIFLTSKTEPTDIVKGFELGAVDYVAKPFNAVGLLGGHVNEGAQRRRGLVHQPGLSEVRQPRLVVGAE